MPSYRAHLNLRTFRRSLSSTPQRGLLDVYLLCIDTHSFVHLPIFSLSPPPTHHASYPTSIPYLSTPELPRPRNKGTKFGWRKLSIVTGASPSIYQAKETVGIVDVCSCHLSYQISTFRAASVVR